NPGIDLRDIVLPAEASFSVRSRPDLLGGVTVLEAFAEIVPLHEDWAEHLYRKARPRAGELQSTAAEITAVPYYAWANRDPGPMRVWLRSR
ncbi:MAG: glycoside hydrolase family 127 protein, partial [Rubrobacteraceae bacterium]|nr:glycoside hydrolase family 127 protein [Rubrobacteraceae bacterium]